MPRPRIIEPEPRLLPDHELTAKVFRTLGDPTRLRILEMLAEHPRIQRELVENLDVSQTQVSQHLGCLTWCGLVEAERAGRTVTYRVADPAVLDIIELGRSLLNGNTGAIAACRITNQEER